MHTRFALDSMFALVSVLLVAVCDAATIYHRDSDHLWNRLHTALVVRTSRDGVEFGHDDIDPLLVNQTTHLLTGKSHARLVHALDEFLRTEDSEELGNSLQRAVLQHDLWSVFDWVAARQVGMQWVGYDDSLDEHGVQRKALLQRLSRAISRLALPEEEIRQLADNYTDAVAGASYAFAYDKNNPHVPFLPNDLLTQRSSWLELGGLAAPVHTVDFGGRSRFRVFMRLPEGRDSTMAFLETLRHVGRRELAEVGFKPFEELDTQLPRFPPYTQFALVRQMMVIDDRDRIHTTDITQSVQIRVHHTRTEFDDEPDTGTSEHQRRLLRAGQDFYEFSLRRKSLFEGQHGGLLPATDETKAIISPLRRHGVEPDPFAAKRAADILSKANSPVRQCVHCHREPNIYSFESFIQSATTLQPVFAKPTIGSDDSAIRWKKSQFGWGMYRGLAS